MRAEDGATFGIPCHLRLGYSGLMTPATHSATTARAAAQVGSLTLLSRVLGFARDAAMAHVLGGGLMADAFFVAFRVPNFLRRLLGEGALSVAFVPVLAGARLARGEASAQALAARVALYLALVVGGLCVLGSVFALPLVTLLAPGLGGDAAAATLATAAGLLKVCLPYGLCACLAGLVMGMWNSRGTFALPALGPVLFNMVLLGGAGLAAAGRGDAAWVLAWAVLLGGVAHCLLTGWPLRGELVRGLRAPADPDTWPCLRRLPGGVFGASVHQINVLTSTFFASLLAEGSITALYYAERLIEFPLGVFGAAVGTATLPALAMLFAARREEAFAQEMGRSLRLALCLNLPAAAGLVAVAEPLVQVLFGHGAFDGRAVAATVQALAGYAVGLPAFAVARLLLGACHARRDARTPVLAGICSVVAAPVAGALLLGPLGVAGPPLGASMASWGNVALLWFGLHRAGVRLQLPLGSLCWQVAGSGLVLWTARWAVDFFGSGAMALAGGVVAGVVAYGVVALLVGRKDMRMMLEGLRRNR